MAGHSHWAGIKHKKGGKIRKEQSYFQNYQEKLQLQLNLATKIQTLIQDLEQQYRLRNNLICQKKIYLEQSINHKNTALNYTNLRYEGYGAFQTALIIETLTENKNRTASSIRTV